jgi:quinoprotein glucose dehydrogenase
MSWRKRAVMVMWLAALSCALVPQLRAGENKAVTWSDYGGGPENSHYVVSNQINKSNVSQLEVAWTYPTRDLSTYQFNPLVVDNIMYVLARNNSLVALDASTGKEIWVHENLTGIARRGINYWESKDRSDRRLIFQLNDTLQEIDARTGKTILTFGRNGVVNLREGLRRDPKTIYRVQSGNPGKVFEDLIVLGSAPGEGYLTPPGDIRAFDVRTGALVWQFHTIPLPGEYGYDTWPKDAYKYSGAANNWGEMSIDAARGIVYIPTGSATYDFYGADRKGANLFANCLLALDARTGKRLWHFQFTHHDLWDYDGTAAPQLITVTQEGRKIDAVALATKQGFLFVFDRVTGKPLWPIEERPVPKSDMPEEEAFATQPFPTAPPPFVRQKLGEDDINPFTSLLARDEQKKWREIVKQSRNEGLYTPPSMRFTVSMPGNRGGANWGSTSADPEHGIVYVAGINAASILMMDFQEVRLGRARGQGAAGLGEPPRSPGEALYQQNCAACHGADRAGSGAIPPLVGVIARLGAAGVQQTVMGGQGPMPAFQGMSPGELREIINYLSRADGGPEVSAQDLAAGSAGGSLGGPVVAAGGASMAQYVEQPEGLNPYGPMGGPEYPDNVETPSERYYSSWNVLRNVNGPPWSTLTAYDLNKGTIKWQVPIGEEPKAVAEGGRNTGLIAEQKAVLATSSGLLFHAGTDGVLRAFDADTGAVLWSTTLPAGARGIPAMYEVDGRTYLVVCATGRKDEIGGGIGLPPASAIPPDFSLQRAYVAFALPQPAKMQTSRQMGQ